MTELEIDDNGLDDNELDDSEFTNQDDPPRQKPSKADLCKSLDYLVRDPVLANAMRCINRRPNTIFLWTKLSREGDPRFLVRWPDPNGAEVRYDQAIIVARQMQCASYEAILRRDVTVGTPRVLRQQNGEPVYEIDHRLVAEFEGDADAARALGVKDPFFLHDQRGARIPVVVYDPSPAALRQHVARSVLAGYNPSDKKEVDTKLSGGVMVIRATSQGADSGKALPPYARERMEAPAALSPLQQDLQRRLADLRSQGPDRVTARPTRPVDTGNGGSGTGDPPERRTVPS